MIVRPLESLSKGCMLKPSSLRRSTLLNNSIEPTMNSNALIKDYGLLTKTNNTVFHSLYTLGGYINRALLYGHMRGWTVTGNG